MVVSLAIKQMSLSSQLLDLRIKSVMSSMAALVLQQQELEEKMEERCHNSDFFQVLGQINTEKFIQMLKIYWKVQKSLLFTSFNISSARLAFLLAAEEQVKKIDTNN